MPKFDVFRKRDLFLKLVLILLSASLLIWASRQVNERRTKSYHARSRGQAKELKCFRSGKNKQIVTYEFIQMIKQVCNVIPIF
jgi:hypothetical protein